MDSSFNGSPSLLEIFVHHARNIHNICIYANQDVYAKFSCTCTPDDTICTQIIAGGGKNPKFNETLTIKVPRNDTILKCEIWMLSRARNFLEDQLLGFALVPISSIAASDKGELIAQDFTLSSTDLFHSPAGTVQLTLTLHNTSDNSNSFVTESMPGQNKSITSEVVILDPAEFGRIEFPDIGVARENQKMISEYFTMGDYEMDSPFNSSTTTSSSNDIEKKNLSENSNASSLETNPDTHTSKCGKGESKNLSIDMVEGSVFKSPLGNININLEDEQNEMQKQIVDMYMRSMQQFTESLAKMKLPMDLDAAKAEDGGDVIQSEKRVDNKLEKVKKDATRVFYGSRAFF